MKANAADASTNVWFWNWHHGCQMGLQKSLLWRETRRNGSKCGWISEKTGIGWLSAMWLPFTWWHVECGGLARSKQLGQCGVSKGTTSLGLATMLHWGPSR